MSLRYELKLVAATRLESQLRALLHGHAELFRQQHVPRQVNSLYFDTPAYGHYRDNLLGNNQRGKLRLRWYGTKTGTQAMQLELKRKFSMLGDKKLILLPEPLDLAGRFIDLRRTMISQLPPAWQMVVREAPEPTLITQYRRHYYVSADGQIRVTFDLDQRNYDQVGYLRPNLRYPVMRFDDFVIEIKAAPIYQERLETLVSALPVQRTKNSKYVNGVTAAIY